MKVTLVCETCGANFQRSGAEAKRNAARGMRVFCSRKCRGKKIFEDTPPTRRKINSDNLKKKVLDELSPFRPHLKSIRCHAAKIGKCVAVDLSDLKKQWDNQNGICDFTGWQMVNYLSTRDNPIRCPERASVDRIDSTKDYTVDNIRFVCLMAQFAKNNFTDIDLIRFCQAVHERRIRK